MIEIVCRGSVLTQYNWRAKSYVRSPEGVPFSIRVSNQLPVRQLVVLSVDGRSVVGGDLASFGSPGVVLRPNETAEIPGFFITSSSCERFIFQEQGVIGAAFFPESPSADNPEFDFDESFRFREGRSEVEFYSKQTKFTRASKIPRRVLKIQHARKDVLVEWGVPIPYDPPEADPFPAEEFPSPADLLSEEDHGS